MASGSKRQAAGQEANPRRLRRGLRPRHDRVFRLLCLLSVACCCAMANTAEEVRWRYEYGESRQEARQTGLPLMIYFAAAWSPQCRKLETTTLQDPGLVRYLNEHYIPVKVEEKREPRLLERLKIREFPTIILAGPDGMIYDSLPAGQAEMAPLRERLQKVVTLLANPEWMTKDHQEAVHAVASGDFIHAVKLLRPIADDKQLRPIQVEARRLLRQIEEKAQKALEAGRELEGADRPLEAAESYQETARLFAGTPAATEAEQVAGKITEKPDVKQKLRQRRAAALLDQAKNDFRSQQWVCCVDRCSALTSGYADLPEGAEAGQLLEQIKANPDWMKALTESLADRLAEMYLATAETWIHKGEPQLAAPYLERVVVSFPGSRHAEIAKLRLAQIQVRPTNPLKFLRSKFQGSTREIETRTPPP